MSRFRIIRRLLPLFIVVGGIAVAAGLVATRPSPYTATGEPEVRLVRTFRATSGPHRVAVKVYGTSRAAEQWSAIAEVSGRITLLNEAFNEGDVLQAGTLLATIDEFDYELSVKAAETDLASQHQQAVELEQTQANVESMVLLRQEQVHVAKTELDRVKTLLERGAGTQSEYDRVSSAFLDRQASLKSLENQLALITVQEKSLAISITAARLRLERAQGDLTRCEVHLPFTALCISRDIEMHQQAAAGQSIGRFLALDRAEVVAMVEPRRALPLFPNLSAKFGPIDLHSQTTSVIQELQRQFDDLDIPADVTWSAGEGHAQWRGRLTRVSATVDETTRSVPLTIEVDDAFSDIQLGVKPALVPGMFVEVVVYGDMLKDVFVVPRDTVRDGKVYVVRDGRLVIVPVHVAALEERLAVIDSGLTDGDQVVLADLFPAAAGMQLRIEEVNNPVKPRLELPAVDEREGLVP